MMLKGPDNGTGFQTPNTTFQYQRTWIEKNFTVMNMWQIKAHKIIMNASLHDTLRGHKHHFHPEALTPLNALYTAVLFWLCSCRHETYQESQVPILSFSIAHPAWFSSSYLQLLFHMSYFQPTLDFYTLLQPIKRFQCEVEEVGLSLLNNSPSQGFFLPPLPDEVFPCLCPQVVVHCFFQIKFQVYSRWL